MLVAFLITESKYVFQKFTDIKRLIASAYYDTLTYHPTGFAFHKWFEKACPQQKKSNEVRRDHVDPKVAQNFRKNLAQCYFGVITSSGNGRGSGGG